MNPWGWFPRSARPSMRPPRAYPTSRSTARFTSSKMSARFRVPSSSLGKSIGWIHGSGGLECLPQGPERSAPNQGSNSRGLSRPRAGFGGMDPLLFIALAIALGFKHSYDADHLVAVSNFIARSSGVRKTTLMSVSWAAGHMAAASMVTLVLYASRDVFLRDYLEPLE